MRLAPLVLAVALLGGCPKSSDALHEGSSPTPGILEALSALTAGGSDVWDQDVEQILVASFDKDGSGRIDTTRELEAIDCAVYRVLDEAVLAGEYEAPVRQIYGFGAGFSWVGGSLGFDESIRAAADAAMADCGLTIP